MVTKPGRMVTYAEGLLTIKSLDFDQVVLEGHVMNKNHFISNTTVPMATKFGRMITYLDERLTIKSHDLLVT